MAFSKLTVLALLALQCARVFTVDRDLWEYPDPNTPKPSVEIKAKFPEIVDDKVVLRNKKHITVEFEITNKEAAPVTIHDIIVDIKFEYITQVRRITRYGTQIPAGSAYTFKYAFRPSFLSQIIEKDSETVLLELFAGVSNINSGPRDLPHLVPLYIADATLLMNQPDEDEDDN